MLMPKKYWKTMQLGKLLLNLKVTTLRSHLNDFNVYNTINLTSI